MRESVKKEGRSSLEGNADTDQDEYERVEVVFYEVETQTKPWGKIGTECNESTDLGRNEINEEDRRRLEEL